MLFNVLTRHIAAAPLIKASRLAINARRAQIERRKGWWNLEHVVGLETLSFDGEKLYYYYLLKFCLQKLRICCQSDNNACVFERPGLGRTHHYQNIRAHCSYSDIPNSRWFRWPLLPHPGTIARTQCIQCLCTGGTRCQCGLMKRHRSSFMFKIWNRGTISSINYNP